MTDTTKPLPVGTLVRKPRGYQYPGVIVAAFLTTRAAPRYVVECTAPGVEGMLHIFSPEQIEVAP